MDADEARKVVETIARWMELRAQGGYEPLSTSREFLSEATHSLKGGLLQRLLVEGKEPLEHTPPLAFSRPWYELIENGEVVVEKDLVTLGDQAVTICKHQWEILEQQEGAYTICWRRGKGGEMHWGRWRLVPNSDSWVLSQWTLP